MKPITQKHFFIFSNKPLLVCENVLSNLFSWLWQLPVPGVSFGLVQSRNLLHLIVHALKGLRAGLDALILSATASTRIYVGLGLMGVAAPLSGCAYMVFDRSVMVEGWYHVNYFHLFFLLGPHLFEFFLLAGVFLLFPQNSKRSFALIVPAGYVLAKILWLISIDNNQEFWSVVPLSFVLMGMLLSAAVFLMLNWITWVKFHGKDAFDKRLDGLYAIADDVSPEKFRSMFLETWRSKRGFNSKY